MISSNCGKDTDDRNRGGVRGIVELVLLNAIQKELGPHVPIQDFFDLIVGTRYALSVISIIGGFLTQKVPGELSLLA